jgi:hypothetical protein
MTLLLLAAALLAPLMAGDRVHFKVLERDSELIVHTIEAQR